MTSPDSSPPSPTGADPSGGVGATGSPGAHADGGGTSGGTRQRRARGRIDRELVVEEGLAYIDDHGLKSLSMRRLGHRLEVEAMTLYRYISSKEDLLDAIADLLSTQMRVDPEILLTPADDRQDFLRSLAHGVRTHALAHPRAFPLLIPRTLPAPWLRSPLGDPGWAESILSGLSEAGWDDAGAIRTYRIMANFLLGHLLQELTSHSVDGEPHTDIAQENPASHGRGTYDEDADDFPSLQRMSSLLASENWATEFNNNLEALLAQWGTTDN